VRAASSDKLVNAFREEVQKQVQELLRSWPSTALGRRTLEREKMLKQKELEDPYVALKGTWQVKCNNCKFKHEVNLVTTGDIKQLLAHKEVEAVLRHLYAGVVKEHLRRASLGEIVGLYLHKYLYQTESQNE
jgi:ribosome-associated toxin RatA of RatAB toxin-antitoxin module